jgi:carbon starvation protein CstA
VLWTITVYLARRRWAFLVTFLPALFMTTVITAYLLFAPEGFSLPWKVAVTAGVFASLAAGTAFLLYRNNRIRSGTPHVR